MEQKTGAGINRLEQDQALPGRSLLALDLAGAEAAAERAIRLYADERRRRIEAFTAATYGLKGSLALHRRAFGHDLWRAPANLALAVPFLAARGGSAAARRLGWAEWSDWLARQRLFFQTDVGREVEWRVMTEFLELPYKQEPGGGDARESHGDALAEVLLGDARVAPHLERLAGHLRARGEDPAFRQWMTETLATYGNTRTAAADLTNALIATAGGGLAFHHFTPGAFSLGPLLAQALATKLAAGSFPLGAGIGSLFYGAFPAGGSLWLTAGVTGGLIGLAAILASVSGVVTDPIQRRLGLHQRRLRRLVDALEHELLEGGGHRFSVRDHYAARLLDLLDLARTLRSG